VLVACVAVVQIFSANIFVLLNKGQNGNKIDHNLIYHSQCHDSHLPHDARSKSMKCTQITGTAYPMFYKQHKQLTFVADLVGAKNVMQLAHLR
jgi:hypothetical protein